MKNLKNKGISLIEILIIISIIGIISAIVVPSFSNFHNRQELKNTTEDIISLLNEARNSTISSKNSNVYGVHFELDRAVLFEGQSYDANNSSNKVIIFDSNIRFINVGGINLNGGGNDVIFTRINGETTNYGTLILHTYLNASNSIINIIQIKKTGLIYLD